MMDLKELHRSFGFPTDDSIWKLLQRGITADALADPWAVTETTVRFDGNHFIPDPSGERSLIFRAEDRGEAVDLIAWRTDKIATLLGVGFCIGDLEQTFCPSSWFAGGGLHIHRSPLEWLLAERRGIVIAQPRCVHAYLSKCPRLICTDQALAADLDKWLSHRDALQRFSYAKILRGKSVMDESNLVEFKRRKPACDCDEPVAPTIEELAQSAASIMASTNVLSLFEKEWKRSIAGEVPNAKLLYLIATSRLLTKTMSAAIKGPSSGGKSEIRYRVTAFIPPEDVISFTTLSEKALIYSTDDFAHKILSMGEAAGADEQSLQDYLLRELISEGRIRYPTVQKVGNQMETIVIEKEGPVTFLVTTTKTALHPENETRMLSLEVDDSAKQTQAVINIVARIEGLGDSIEAADLQRWHDFQRWLAAGPRDVVIRFAEDLGAIIPPKSVRLRRDFGQVLRAIKAHALLHRAHRQLDAKGRIIAERADYEA